MASARPLLARWKNASKGPSKGRMLCVDCLPWVCNSINKGKLSSASGWLLCRAAPGMQDLAYFHWICSFGPNSARPSERATAAAMHKSQRLLDMVALTHPSAKQCHGVTLRLLGQFGARRLRFSMTRGRLASAILWGETELGPVDHMRHLPGARDSGADAACL